MVARNGKTEETAASRKPESDPTLTAAVEFLGKLKIFVMLRCYKKEARKGVERDRHECRYAENHHEDGVAAVELSRENPFGAFDPAQVTRIPGFPDIFGKGVNIHGTPE